MSGEPTSQGLGQATLEYSSQDKKEDLDLKTFFAIDRETKSVIYFCHLCREPMVKYSYLCAECEKGISKWKVDQFTNYVLNLNEGCFVTFNEHILEYKEDLGTYIEVNPNEAEHHIRKDLDDLFPNIPERMVKEVIAKIKTRTLTGEGSFERNDNDPRYVHVANGWLNKKTRELEPHSPERHSMLSIPPKYDPEAKCPVFSAFLESALSPEGVRCFKKLMGYLLVQENPKKKAFLLIGPKDSGKTTARTALEAFVGSDLTTHLSLHTIIEDRFSLRKLKGKWLCTESEINQRELIDSGVFKEITGNDEIEARTMFSQREDKFIVRAKLVIASNKPPVFKDVDKTIIDRWVVLEFDNVPEVLDEQLKHKINTPRELSGMLNMALEGLEMLEEDGEFMDVTYAELERKWQLRASAISEYFGAYLERKEDIQTDSKDLYEHYMSICALNPGMKRLSPQQFSAELETMGYEHKQVREGKKRKYVFLNVAIKGTTLSFPLEVS